MVDMPATPYQRQPVCPTAFPHHSLSTQNYGTIVLEGYGTQGFEGVANIADAQYYVLKESQQASQVLEDCELDAWSRNSNAVPDVREEINQTLIEDLFPLEVNHWDITPSQSLHRHAHPHLITTPQHDQQRQDYPSSSIASPTRQNGFGSLYSSQPLHHPPQPSSLSSNSETVSLEEDDLRRLRNTAASARFRAKKRLREQSLQRSDQQKREKLAALEARIRQLEAENKWLKSLIIEKHHTEDIEVLSESVGNRKEV